MLELLHGDCLDMIPFLGESSVDLVLADPPYGKTRNKWDSIIDLAELWPKLWHVAKPNAAIIMTAQTHFSIRLASSCIKHFKYDLVWRKSRKGGFLNAKKAPLRGHENILVFYKNAPVFNPQKTEGHRRIRAERGAGFCSDNYREHTETTYDSTERYPDSILEFKSERGLHPTQKPVALMRYLIETYSRPGGLVLDFAAGSGTVGVAAHGCRRGYLGIEKDPGHYATARARPEGLDP